jgi:hypothetical protein
MAEVRPSEVRTRALHEYDLLRTTIDELEAIAAELRLQGPSAVDNALAWVAKLFRELSDYVDLEQLLVLPTVRNADIWGCIRANALAKEHETRRDQLGALGRTHSRPVDPTALVLDLEAFAQTLRESMDRERRDVLTSDAFRDDVVETEAD